VAEFDCAICHTPISFKLNNEDSYISKEESGNALLGSMFTYRVEHTTELEKHINVVVYDTDGNYRAHKDVYKENIVDSQIDIESQFQKLLNRIPVEIKHIFSLADKESKQYLIRFSTFDQLRLEEIYIEISKVIANTSKPVIYLLYSKLCLILGKNIELPKEPTVDDWHYCLILRKQARAAIEPEILDQVNEIQVNLEQVEAEIAIAQAEIALRLSEIEALEKIYQAYVDWKQDPEIFKKQAFYTIQAYYGYGLFLQGQFQEGLELVEPAFNFSQIIDSRELILIAGNFYGSIIKNSGQLEQAKEVYSLVRDTADEIGDERSVVVVSNNIGTTLYQTGQLEEALIVFDEVRNHSIAQKEFILALVAIINSAEALLELSRIDEAIEIIKEGMVREIPLQYRIAVYRTFLTIIRASSDNELMEYFDLQSDLNDFEQSVNGKILLLDVDATKAEMNGQYGKAIDYLKQSEQLLEENNQLENLSAHELRMAELYFAEYKESRDESAITSSFELLDKIIIHAREQGYHGQVYQMTYLKAMMAAEMGSYDRVEKLLTEAKSIIHAFNLETYLEEIDEAIDKLHSGELLDKDYRDTRSMFANLTDVQNVKIEPKESEVNLVHIYANDLSWDIKFVDDSLSELEQGYYAAIQDTWRLIKSKFDSQTSAVIRGKFVIMMDFTSNFHILVMSDHEDSRIRRVIHDLLVKLENFELSPIISEREEYTKQIVSEELGL